MGRHILGFDRSTPPRFASQLASERTMEQRVEQVIALPRGLLLLAARLLVRAGQPFRPGLRVKGVQGHPGVFEITWEKRPRTISYTSSLSRAQCGRHSNLVPLVIFTANIRQRGRIQYSKDELDGTKCRISRRI